MTNTAVSERNWRWASAESSAPAASRPPNTKTTVSKSETARGTPPGRYRGAGAGDCLPASIVAAISPIPTTHCRPAVAAADPVDTTV